MKSKLIIALILILGLNLKLEAQTVPVGQTIPNAINYTLPADENVVSKAIYTPSLVLVKTLDQNKKESAGTHTVVWDGTDNDGNLQTIGAQFKLIVAYNNNTYIWEGPIGNTSDSTTGTSVLRGGSQVTCATQVGSKVFIGTGYSEQNASQKYFNISTPQQCTTYTSKPNVTGQTTYFNCASSKFMFWGGENYDFSKSFVFPERLSNNTEINFSGSVFNSQPGGRGYNCLDLTASSGLTGMITGMSCQQNGNGYLFIAHGSLNSIDVLRTSDSTNTKVQTISITGVTALAVDKDNDNVLWVAMGTTVNKYTINSDGSITSTASTITGFNDVRSLHIQGGDLAVLDGGTKQILKRYNSTTLALTGTIGIVGGYASTPVVSNTRFYLNDLGGPLATFVTHDASGGFYIGDAGNARVQHFDSSGNFIESIMHIGTYATYATGTNKGIGYPVNICTNQNTALFGDFMEFIIDYSQPLKTGWTLTNNYGYKLPAGWHNTNSISGVHKYINGRRFMIITQSGTSNSYWAELTSTGLNIITSPLLPQFCAFDKSGNLTTFNVTNKFGPNPSVLTYQKYVVTMPSSGNPTVGSASTIATIQSGYQEPSPVDRAIHVTANGKIVVFDPSIDITRNPSFPNFYHYGIYDSLTMTRLARLGVGTPSTYKGDYPSDGSFDIGNGVLKPGGTIATVGNYFYAGYHGEFWKQTQTNIFYKFNDLGLLQGIFGVTGVQVVRGTAPYGFAGNALAVITAQSGGNDYIYHGDESVHDGYHRWKISNTGSEGLLTIPFNVTNRTYSPPNNVIDLLANVPGGQVSIQGLAGTSQVPSTDVKNNSSTSSPGQFYSVTATNNYLTPSHDVQLYATGLTGNRKWKFNLTGIPAQWTFGGQLDLTINSFVDNESSSTVVNYVELSDNVGKAIARVYLYNSNRFKINGTFKGPFNNPKSGASDFTIQRVQNSNNVYFSIMMWGDILPTTYSGPMYDVTADITHPASFSVNVQNSTVGFHLGINKLYSPL